jgi:hypothetical protein
MYIDMVERFVLLIDSTSERVQARGMRNHCASIMIAGNCEAKPDNKQGLFVPTPCETCDVGACDDRPCATNIELMIGRCNVGWNPDVTTMTVPRNNCCVM